MTTRNEKPDFSSLSHRPFNPEGCEPHRLEGHRAPCIGCCFASRVTCLEVQKCLGISNDNVDEVQDND